jgi:8-amino-7-oxononanoate synthase
MDFDAFLAAELERTTQAGLRRSLRVLDSPQGSEVVCQGRTVVNFSSNDYLGLAADPRLRAAAAEAVDRFGAGAGASRLICGTLRVHEDLEAALAAFKGTAAALSFSTGFAAAVGVIPALVGSGDVLILDKLCHACLVDGARLSGATIRVFPHNHLEKLSRHLAWAREKYPSARVLVVVESVYSMDGDRAPLREIVELKDRFGAWVMVDDAHGVGVLGARGRGLADDEALADRVEVQMGTLGKALGSAGAYVCGSDRLRDFLVNRARSFIFSTAPAPAAAAASRAAVQILDSAEGRELVGSLWRNIHSLGALLGARPESAIFPVVIGAELAAVAAAQEVLAAGFLVPAIRYPTVARGSARLRVALSASHTADQIGRLAGLLRALPGYGAAGPGAPSEVAD